MENTNLNMYFKDRARRMYFLYRDLQLDGLNSLPNVFTNFIKGHVLLNYLLMNLRAVMAKFQSSTLPHTHSFV